MGQVVNKDMIYYQISSAKSTYSLNLLRLKLRTAISRLYIHYNLAGMHSGANFAPSFSRDFSPKNAL